MTKNSVVRRKGEGDAFWMLNGLYEVKASGEETNGEMTVMEMTIPEGGGPPPHIHPGSESVYIVEGTLRYHIGNETFEGGPGSFFHIPTGTLERFEPTSTVRMVITYTPGGIDKFFAEAGEPAQRRELPPPSDTAPDVERLVEVGRRHNIDMRPMHLA
ncbi:cupin domain-containing protein [Streptomyces nigrescens]|uniref:cupin domain-containing protein n=1 Tax=Streptomyces nigrescens TaxID=1920 RepID=UPI0034892099